MRTKEYAIMKRCEEIFRPDMSELTVIETIDIPIDFTNNICKKCSKVITEKEEMYYCYFCKDKYCTKCVMDNFKDPKNKGLKQFIDPKHNLLFFKTRDLNQFKNIEKFKLGTNSFSRCTDESKLGAHSMSCNGCGQLQNYVRPRYLCLSCLPGIKQDNGFADYCLDCINHMSNGDENGKKYKQRELNYIIKKHDFFMRIKLR